MRCAIVVYSKMRRIIEILLLFCAFVKCSSSTGCVTKFGVVGTCKAITECESILDNLNDLSPCDFDGSIGIFCCPNSLNPMHENITKSCRKNLKMREQLQPNIVNYDKDSMTSSISELPHMVQVIFSEKGFVGAGVLLSENFVLTSAHIIYVRTSMPVVRLGKVS